MRWKVRKVDTPVKGAHRLKAVRALDQRDRIARADRAGGIDDGVDARARIEAAADVEPVVLGERLEDLRVLRKVALRDGRHDAPGIGHERDDAYVVADR